MLTISKPLNAAQATQYHREQFRDVTENYYTEGQQIRGQWEGKLASAWGLTGDVSETQFTRLAHGRHPLTDAPLVRAQTAHPHTTAEGAT